MTIFKSILFEVDNRLSQYLSWTPAITAEEHEPPIVSMLYLPACRGGLGYPQTISNDGTACLVIAKLHQCICACCRMS